MTFGYDFVEIWLLRFVTSKPCVRELERICSLVTVIVSKQINIYLPAKFELFLLVVGSKNSRSKEF